MTVISGTREHVLTKRPCPGSGVPLIKMGWGHYSCTGCWRHWRRENVGPNGTKQAPLHGFKYDWRWK